MRFHLVGLVHLPASAEYMSCAFTQKNIKLAKMLLGLGHEVYYYGCEGSTLPCTEFIQTHTLADTRKEWGEGDNRYEIGYNWHGTDFRHDFNKPKTKTTLKFYQSCINEINKRKRPDDFLLLSQGVYHRPIDKGVNLYLTCEPGIGYRGSYARFRAFESSYIQNFTYGSQRPFKCSSGNYYDRVIPNYFDPKDVEFKRTPDGDYYLYIGRMIKSKGILTAYLTCKAINKKLILVGQGAKINEQGHLVGTYNDFRMEPGNWEYQGYADVSKRKRLMGNAIATFTPTEYLECFGGTHIESRLHGTPVLTTDFGVYPGTVVNGRDGYRCNTLKDFVEKAKIIGRLDRYAVRQHAEPYLNDNVAKLYQQWFDDLYALYESTLGTGLKGWHRL